MARWLRKEESIDGALAGRKNMLAKIIWCVGTKSIKS